MDEIGASTTTDSPSYLTRREMAEVLRCSTRQLDKMRIQGLPVDHFVGREPRFDREAVLTWVRGFYKGSGK